MDELAELATRELLQQEIDALKLEIESLQCELLESKEHCRRLEEEASLQLGIERLLDETDDDFKKRKRTRADAETEGKAAGQIYLPAVEPDVDASPKSLWPRSALIIENHPHDHGSPRETTAPGVCTRQRWTRRPSAQQQGRSICWLWSPRSKRNRIRTQGATRICSGGLTRSRSWPRSRTLSTSKTSCP